MISNTQQLQQTPENSDKDSEVVFARKHKHTLGEKVFDLSVYAGIGWGVNTALSVYVADLFQNGAWQKGMKTMTAWAEKNLLGSIKSPETRKSMAANAFFISTIYSGGTLLVLPIRWLEGRKNVFVRKFNNWWQGRDLSKDPEFEAAHREMEHEPQQSMHSLIWARLLALPAGLALSPLMGNEHALTTKIIGESTPLRNYSSFQRASTSITRDIAAMRKPFTDQYLFPHLRDAALEAKRISPYSMMEHESRRMKLSATAIYDLMLSAVVATGFYTTSKLFARMFAKRDEHRHEMQAEAMGRALTHDAFDKAPAMDTHEEVKRPLSSKKPPVAENDNDTFLQRENQADEAQPKTRIQTMQPTQLDGKLAANDQLTPERVA